MSVKTMNWHVYTMGQPLFACQPPTGYPEDSRKWVSAGALISRVNFAVDLAGGRVMDATLVSDDAADAQTPEQLLDGVLDRILCGEVSPATRETLLKKATELSGDDAPARITALVLGTPEFQRR
jgi:uncharacterized protein (DUF1800 family)